MAVEFWPKKRQHLSWKGIGLMLHHGPRTSLDHFHGKMWNFVEVGLCTSACNMNFSFSGLLQLIDKPFINDSHKGKLVI